MHQEGIFIDRPIRKAEDQAGTVLTESRLTENVLQGHVSEKSGFVVTLERNIVNSIGKLGALATCTSRAVGFGVEHYVMVPANAMLWLAPQDRDPSGHLGSINMCHGLCQKRHSRANEQQKAEFAANLGFTRGLHCSGIGNRSSNVGNTKEVTR